MGSCYEKPESGESHLETNTTTLVRCVSTVIISAVHAPSSKIIKLLHCHASLDIFPVVFLWLVHLK